MKKSAAAIAITTRRVPDFSGTPGKIVSLDSLELNFGRRRTGSPYDILLDDLATATDEAVAAGKPRPGLEFGNVKAQASVYQRAKKKNLRVVFAVSGERLYVRMEGRYDDNIREQRRTAIKRILLVGPMTYIPITNKLREGGDLSVQASEVDPLLNVMMKAGEVIRQEGGAWKLAPKK